MFIFGQQLNMEMENTEETQEINEPIGLVVTEEMRSYIYESARWMGFLAIIGFVFSGLTIMTAFTVGGAIATKPELAAAFGPLAKTGSIVITIVCLLFAFLIFYPSLLMFKYAAKAKLGVLYSEQNSLNEAFGNFKSLFKFWGIIVILWIGLNVLLIFSTLIGGPAVA